MSFLPLILYASPAVSHTAAWSQKYGVDAFTKGVSVTLNGCVCISAVYSLLCHLFNVPLSFLRIKACRGQHTPVCT